MSASEAALDLPPERRPVRGEEAREPLSVHPTQLRLPLKLLYWYKHHRFTTFFVVTFVSFVFAKALFAAIGGGFAIGVLSDVGQNVASAIFAVAVSPLLLALAIRRDIESVLSIAAEAGGENKTPILSFLSDSLAQMKTQLSDLQGGGAELEPYEVAQWVRRCFGASRCHNYVGTDSHVPNEYREVYADYLSAHQAFLRRVSEASSKRIMVNSMDRLRADRREFPSENESFVAWHSRHRVELEHIETNDLARLLQEDRHSDLRRFQHTDIGFWEGEYVLLFNPNGNTGDAGSEGKIRVRVAFKGDAMYEAAARYVRLLERAARPLDKELPIYPPELSNGWKRFALPEKRLAQTGPFLESIIAGLGKPKDDVWIFDAATGVGFETVHLLKNGYFVQANEIEASLREAAKQYAADQGVTIPSAQFSSSDWLSLEYEHQQGRYDVVLVLGNSLCHLETTEQLRTAITQFHLLLRPGGVLVCDERNFDAILRDWSAIRDDPINNFAFNQNPDRVMYCGTDVLGAPFTIADNRVVFEYWEVVKAGSRYRRQERLGSLSMLAFREGVMRRMLSEAGFGEVETMYDLTPKAEFAGRGREADFFTHVAVK